LSGWFSDYSSYLVTVLLTILKCNPFIHCSFPISFWKKVPQTLACKGKVIINVPVTDMTNQKNYLATGGICLQLNSFPKLEKQKSHSEKFGVAFFSLMNLG
jgi:hypothetical protein